MLIELSSYTTDRSQKNTLLYRPPIGCNPHTVQIQPCALNLIPSGLQLEELSVAQNKVVILIDPSSTQINILTFTVDDEVLTATRLLDGYDGMKKRLRKDGLSNTRIDSAVAAMMILGEVQRRSRNWMFDDFSFDNLMENVTEEPENEKEANVSSDLVDTIRKTEKIE